MASDYERAREENIAKNKLLLQQLQLDAGSLGALDTPGNAKRKRESGPKPTTKRTPRAKKEHVESQPRRQSSRIKGIQPDSAAAAKAEEEFKAREDTEKAKRARVGGDLTFDMDTRSIMYADFTIEDVRKTEDVDLREMRERMMGLTLLPDFEPNEIKITYDRIYHLGFHPTVDKALVFAGDKPPSLLTCPLAGNLGIFDASAKKETDNGDPVPDISQFKLHTRTLSCFQFDPETPNALYTASYDGSVRRFDLSKGVASEVFVAEDEDPLSSLELLDPSTLLFSTLNGAVGRRDLRSKDTAIWQLSEKKIGGFGPHPSARHLVATASLDRTVKIWDLRRIVGKKDERMPALKAEHTSKLSVSCALWSPAGTLATTSYDDTVKLYAFPNAASWAPDFGLGEVQPTKVIPHNNQTGRWVTILRAQWQQNPKTGGKFVIANMSRGIDIYNEVGERLAQLADNKITAVPAVTQFHPSMDWVVGGTGSGKLVLYM